MPEPKLLMVDGTNVAYRAFYAIADLSTKAGRPTNAVFGFIKMIQQAEDAWRPTHEVVVFDGGLPAERVALLEEYKAQRKPMPDDLRGQFEPIEAYLDCAGVPHLRVEGQEADDVMATLADDALRRGLSVVIVSSDKDLYQLVTDQLVIASPAKNGSRMGPSEVMEKTGVSPAGIVDWLALTGDSVDNIPGVPGVGPKTAAGLLAQFGTVEGLLGRLAEVSSERIRSALAENTDVILRNRSMVRLRRDLPLGRDADSFRKGKPDNGALLKFYREMEFGSLARAAEEAEREGPMLDFG